MGQAGRFIDLTGADTQQRQGRTLAVHALPARVQQPVRALVQNAKDP